MEKNLSTNIKNYIQNLQLISILVDYRLKDMYGDQVACEINKINGVKIMLISAYDLENEKVVI